MEDCTRKNLDISVQIGELGTYSKDVTLDKAAVPKGKSVAVIGGGAAGLTVAWQLIRQGYDVTVFESDAKMGGKLEQVIPRSRLPQQTLAAELKRIKDMGVVFKNNTPVDREKFSEIRANYDAVVVATGGHKGRVIPWPGHERIVKGIDFLKGINKGKSPKVGKHVIVIGCGNSGMDAAVGAYEMGAEHVTCIDVQRPAADDKEIAHVEDLGVTLMWPVVTKEVTAEGIITQDDQFIKGDTIIIAIGEVPELEFLPEEIVIEKGHLKVAGDYRIAEGVYTAGDAVKPGRMVDAIGAAQQAAAAVDAYLTGTTYQLQTKTKIDKNRLSTAYFKKCHTCDVPKADDDHLRCISCGTCRDCHMCERSCPENAITRTLGSDGNFEYISNANKCIGCGICAGICPCGIWSMHANKQPIHA
jgi:NADPH-dependent glutamate synthase beta subunit-like oxidoreductase/ferredoxin